MNFEPSSGGITESTIDVSVPGSDEFLEILRGVVGRATRVAGFTYDGIEDFALAVDEAAVLLLEGAPSRLRLRVLDVASGASRVTALVTAEGLDEAWPSAGLESSMRWQVLGALSERVWLLDGDGAGIGLVQTIR